MSPESLTDALHEKASATSVGPAPLERIRRNALRRRRGVQAAVAASVVTAVILAGVAAFTRQTDPAEPPATNVTPTPTPTPTPTASADPPETFERWDPRGVDDLPRVDERDFLPEVVTPPQSSPLLEEAPIEAAVLTVRIKRTAQLLSTSGEWRSVPLGGRFAGLSLSPGGSKLLVTQYADYETVLVHDLASGTSKQLDYPSGFEPWDHSSWAWVDEQTVLLDDQRGGWLVDADTGESEQVSYPEELGWAMDPDGNVVETPDIGPGRLASLRADAETVVGTSYDGGLFSLVTADGETLHPRAVLPLGDHDGSYSNGGLSVLSLRDDGTVLLRVYVLGGPGHFRIVRWDPVSGDLAVVSSVDTPIENAVWFADGLLRQFG